MIIHTLKEIENAVKGCMIGGAAGDALGYVVEFIDEKWKKDLELEDLILELSEDLARHDFDRTDEQGRKVWELRYTTPSLSMAHSRGR